MLFGSYFNLKIFLPTRLFIVLILITLQMHLDSAWISDGICADELGYSVNNFLDKCFRGHHFFSAMRAYSLKYLYRINCCPGYKEISRIGGELKCSAICSTQCTSGICIKPETCGCRTGYFLKSQYVCSPVCYPSCINGQCIGVDFCMCNNGFRKLNGSNYNCEPICEPSCENGHCISPGICKCNKGYKFKTGSLKICEPDCEDNCKNGVCSQPGVCECLIGYKKSAANMCEPVCHSGCGVGTCSNSDECLCPSGYRAVKGESCKPLCKACSEGTCVLPDVCHCPGGATLNNLTGECEQICSPPCINGECLAPGECSCKEGYAINKESHNCEPICEYDCINGHCIGTNKCQCYSGYKLKPLSQYECEPICSAPCLRGICIAPEICQCLTGYVEILKNVCGPICLNGCEPGTCTAPNICECPEGYYTAEGGSCKPICSSPCDKGFCIAPDVCICSDGYFWDDMTNKCVSTCKEPCINSICISPNECECFEGYEKVSDSYCYPRCTENCTNGVCSSPDFCSCKLGFNNHPEEWFNCLPELGNEIAHAGLTLNVYKFPSSIRFLEDNETFFFTSLPKFTVKKDCDIFPWTNVSDHSSESFHVQVSCTLLSTFEELNVELYCTWPLEDTDLLYSNWKNVSIENNTLDEHNILWDFKLHILFPEELSEVEDGNCTICFDSFIQPRYFSLNSIETLVLKHCNADELQRFNEKVQANKWIALNSVHWIIILFGVGLAITLLLRFYWFKYRKTESGDGNDVKLETMDKENLVVKPHTQNKRNQRKSNSSSDLDNFPIIQASDL